VWEGLGVVKTGRVMLGETDPVSKCFAFLWFAIITKLLSNNEGKNASAINNRFKLLKIIVTLFQLFYRTLCNIIL